ncbi:MAG: hypothetical protein D6812_06400, partial [Deltaproteobacteria bacterium]
GSDLGATSCDGFPEVVVYVSPKFGAEFVGDDALALLEGVRCIEGSVAIREVSSLQPLQELRIVTGSLSVTDSDLTTLVPLASLTAAYRLELNRLDGLGDLDGLENLRAVDLLYIGRSSLSVLIEEVPEEGNDGLTDMSALAGLEVSDTLKLGNNAALASLEGLPSVAPRYVEITLNSALPVAEVLAYQAKLSDTDELLHCGNLGDEPCELLPPS